MKIRIDDLNGTQVKSLLREHLDSMALYSPPESIHALNIDSLQQPDITFWTIWKDDELLGCGALKQLDKQHAEIKSMRTSSSHLRKGVASKMLTHLISTARQRSYQKLSLETGSMLAFAPARQLYAHHGFTYCDPFADYDLDPYSVFMTKTL